jgi:hypothetical protein
LNSNQKFGLKVICDSCRIEITKLNYGLHRSCLLKDITDSHKKGSGNGDMPALQRMELLRRKKQPLALLNED